MSEFGGLWKHENNQHASPKTDCGCLSGGGIKTVTYATPTMEGTQKNKKKTSKETKKQTNKEKRGGEEEDF